MLWNNRKTMLRGFVMGRHVGLTPLMAVLLWCFVGGGVGTTKFARGQSFLEQLEKAVRSQLNNSANQGEPARKEDANDQGNQGGNVSVDELPAPRSGASREGGQAASDTSNALSSSDGIYLGLEVQDQPDGGIGVRVTQVDRGGPAADAGLQPGDRILAVNGYAIANVAEMARQLSRVKPADTVRLLVNRRGTNREITVRALSASEAPAGAAGSTRGTERERGWLGAIVVDLTEAFRQRFALKVFRGAAITNVHTGSPAKLAGLQPGDVIVEVDGIPIETADQFATWMATTRPGQKIELLYYRGPFARRAEIVLVPEPASERAARTNQPPAVTATEPRSSTMLELPPPAGNQNRATVQGDDALRRELADLRAENEALRAQLTEVRQKLQQTRDQLEALLRALNPDATNR